MIVIDISVYELKFHNKMEVSEPKWVNPNDISYGVNSLRLGDFQMKVYRHKYYNNRTISIMFTKVILRFQLW